jgi:putative transposase
MTDHVHILCTPDRELSVSQMMQALARRYVQYFNRRYYRYYRYYRSGTLWEGRFSSCLVQEQSDLLPLYRYIELKPVRAGLVSDPAYYSWSRYQCNGLGKISKLLSLHPLFSGLQWIRRKR